MPVQALHHRRLMDECQDTLQEKIDRNLRASGYMSLRDVKVTETDGCVYLEGRVSSYHLKQLAQAVAMAVDGVETLQNDLIVR